MSNPITQDYLDDTISLDRFMGRNKPRRVECYGQEILDFVAIHFDLTPLTQDAFDATQRARKARAKMESV